MKTEAEMGVMLPEVKECQEPPGTRRGNEDFPLVFRGSAALPTLGFLTFGLQN